MSRTMVLKISVLGQKYLVNYLLFGHKFPLLSDILTFFFFFSVSLEKVPLDTGLIIVLTYSKIEIKIQKLICSTLWPSFASIFFFPFRVDRSFCLSVAETKMKKNIVKTKASQCSLHSFLTRTMFRG